MKFTNSTSVTNWSAYGTSEYLLMAHPNGDAHDKVIIEKKKFNKKYGGKDATKALPHITVATFLATGFLEKTLIYQFQQACNHQPTFLVTLNDYSSFLQSRTIFLKVQNDQPFKELIRGFNAIKNFYKSHNFPPIWFTNRPHVSLIRGLSDSVYYKAASEYERLSFYESFKVSELVLLKRKYQYDTCQTVGVFKLLSQKPPTQLKLDL